MPTDFETMFRFNIRQSILYSHNKILSKEKIGRKIVSCDSIFTSIRSLTHTLDIINELEYEGLLSQ